jgi:tRNA nucleotidyltransferase/poly(A) polymerase
MTNKQAAIKIIRKLRRSGFEALLAGGCVRDMLLRRPAKDYDVATNARPADVIRLFNRTLKVGAKFGVIMVLINEHQIEVATFRTETGYHDGRHPTSVKFSTAAQDASRRDFTINGMFYDPVDKKIIDYVDGRKDLAKGFIRTIGDARQRFKEDYLRMLRAIRFSTQLAFNIVPDTWSAICDNARYISRISGERIAMELEAILTNPGRENGTRQLVRCGLAEIIFPDFTTERSKFGTEVLSRLPKKVDFELAVAALFAGCDTDYTTEKCAVLKPSKSRRRHIKFLLANRGKLLDFEMPLAHLKIILSEPYFWDLYELQAAIQKVNKESLSPLLKTRRRARTLVGKQLRPKPLLNGHDLIQLGAVPGPQVGHLAQELYIVQLSEEVKTAEQARQWVRKWLRRHNQIED